MVIILSRSFKGSVITGYVYAVSNKHLLAAVFFFFFVDFIYWNHRSLILEYKIAIDIDSGFFVFMDKSS